MSLLSLSQQTFWFLSSVHRFDSDLDCCFFFHLEALHTVHYSNIILQKKGFQVLDEYILAWSDAATFANYSGRGVCSNCVYEPLTLESQVLAEKHHRCCMQA